MDWYDGIRGIHAAPFSVSLMGRAGRIIGWRPVTYQRALLGLALGLCGAFALACVLSEALWKLLGVPWHWHAIRFGLLIGLFGGWPADVLWRAKAQAAFASACPA